MLEEVLILISLYLCLILLQVVDSIVDDMLELSERPAGMLDCLEVIEDELHSELFIIIHNLDGPMLQSNKSQDVLSRLAMMEQIHLIASIDHINAPLSEFLFYFITVIVPWFFDLLKYIICIPSC
jgi:origin recognition complex subunit 2